MILPTIWVNMMQDDEGIPCMAMLGAFDLATGLGARTAPYLRTLSHSGSARVGMCRMPNDDAS